MTETKLTRKEEMAFSLLQLLKPEMLANPYALFDKLRDYEPVHWDPFTSSWVVTSYAECVTVLTKFSAARTPTPERMEAMGLGVLSPYAALMLKQILFMDAPDHTRIRSMCSVAFTPKRIALLREAIQRIADELIDQVADKGKMDILADFAAHFPSRVMTALLGLPTEDSPKIRRWGTDLGELAGNFEQDVDRITQLAKSLTELTDYISAQVTLQQSEPSDGVIAQMIAAEPDASGQRLTHDEIVSNVILLIGAGVEETANLITNGMFSLLSRPEAQAQLANDPSILGSAVEELLRFESTTQYTGRVAPDDVLLGGKQIRKGEAVTAVLAAANRDPERFPNPDTLDLTRTDNKHLAFSYAGHYCLGAPLARMAAAIAFSTLVTKLPGLNLVSTTPRWRSMAAMRSLQSLPVTFTPVSERQVA